MGKAGLHFNNCFLKSARFGQALLKSFLTYTASADGTVIAYDLTGTRGFARRISVGSGNLLHITIPAGQLHGYANFAASPSGSTIATT